MVQFALKLSAVAFFLSVSVYPVSAQYLNTDNLLQGTMNIPWKWTLQQNWDEISNLWGDTSSITYATGGTLKQPAELISKMRNEDGSWVIMGKEVYTYENGKPVVTTSHIYDVLGGTYESTATGVMNYTWEGDIISKIVMDYSLSKMLLEGSMPEDVAEILRSQDIRWLLEINRAIENGKITGVSTREKMVADPAVLALIADSLAEYGFPSDTGWSENAKSVVTTGNNYQIYDNYIRDSESEEWINSSKDSVVLDGDKIIEEISIYNFLDDWIYDTRDSSIYNSDGSIAEVITSNWNLDSWTASYRQVFLYDDYSGASIRSYPQTAKKESLRAEVKMNGKTPMLNFALSGNSSVAVELFNIQGKSVSGVIRKNLSAGTSTIALNSVSQGNYFCRINTGKSSMVVPFRVLR